MLQNGIQFLGVVIYYVAVGGAISPTQESELEQRIKVLVHIQKDYYRTVAAELENMGQSTT